MEINGDGIDAQVLELYRTVWSLEEEYVIFVGEEKAEAKHEGESHD